MSLVKYLEDFDFSPNVLNKPYLIAEAGVNHEGSMELAKRLIDETAEGGAPAIKFQSYKANTIASKHSPYYWDISKEPTKSQFELFQKYDKFWKDEFEKLKVYCDQAGVEFLSTPFDIESATFLNDLMDVFKISSSDLTNKPFIEYIADFGKPILLSTGASQLWEIFEAVEWIQKKGNPIVLMHCILNYPTPDDCANLGMILDLKRRFPELVIGYSDHTLPGDMTVLETSTIMGAPVLEKHFTFDKTLPGNDHYHAMDKEDMKVFYKNMDRLFTRLGSFKKSAIPTEDKSRKNARRSLVAAKNIPMGKIIEASDLTFKRPAFGVSPREIDSLIGKKAKAAIERDSIMYWELVEKND